MCTVAPKRDATWLETTVEAAQREALVSAQTSPRCEMLARKRARFTSPHGNSIQHINFGVKMSEVAAYIGQRLSLKSQTCTVRYVGQVADKQGQWLGVEWDDASRGKHDGTHEGVSYFKCRSICLFSFDF